MKIKLLAASALLAGTAYGAQAADLGGNCCADLEERVAELEATVARKGNRKVSLEVSGHVNQAFLYWDGLGEIGDEIDDRAIINNSNSTSRFRFKGSAAITQDWSAGFLMELGAGDVSNTGSPEIRHQALYVKSKTLGTLWLGKTSQATDGIMEISLASSDPSTLGSLSPFDTFIAAQTGLSLDNPFDGNRVNVIRYISPAVAGFVLSAAWADGGDNDDWDVALRYAGEFGAIRLAAGIGYRQERVSVDFDPAVGDANADDRDFWGGSISVMHTPSGLFLDGQYGRSDGIQSLAFDPNVLLGSPGGPVFNDVSVGTDARMDIWGGRVGFARSFWAIGKTTAYFEYNQLQIKGADVDPFLYGIGLAQEIDPAAMTIYAGWRHIDLDLGDDDSADVFIIGSKIRF